MPFANAIEAAEAYDAWFEKGWGRYAFRVESQALLRVAGTIANLRVLDVGSGTGRFTAELQQRGAEVVAVDNDLAMVSVTRTKHISPIVIGDAAHLPFASGSIDVAFAVTVCEFVDDVGAVFAELARVVRPNGQFVVGSLNPRSPWGLVSRARFKEQPWVDARFLSRAELLRLGEAHGKASLHASLYSTEKVMFPALEALSTALPQLGAFQVLVVEKMARSGESP